MKIISLDIIKSICQRLITYINNKLLNKLDIKTYIEKEIQLYTNYDTSNGGTYTHPIELKVTNAINENSIIKLSNDVNINPNNQLFINYKRLIENGQDYNKTITNSGTEYVSGYEYRYNVDNNYVANSNENLILTNGFKSENIGEENSSVDATNEYLLENTNNYFKLDSNGNTTICAKGDLLNISDKFVYKTPEQVRTNNGEYLINISNSSYKFRRNSNSSISLENDYTKIIGNKLVIKQGGSDEIYKNLGYLVNAVRMDDASYNNNSITLSITLVECEAFVGLRNSTTDNKMKFYQPTSIIENIIKDYVNNAIFIYKYEAQQLITNYNDSVYGNAKTGLSYNQSFVVNVIFINNTKGPVIINYYESKTVTVDVGKDNAQIVQIIEEL